MKRQEGYFLVEIMVLAAMLIAMTAIIGWSGKIATLRQVNGARVEAMYLTQAELSYLEYRAANHALPMGSVEWLGNADDLQQISGSYAVSAEIELQEANAYLATATARWQTGTHSGKAELQRVLIIHQKGADADAKQENAN